MEMEFCTIFEAMPIFLASPFFTVSHFQSGDARVAMVGFPSVGKSTLLSTITKTESAQASYEFTTLTCIPGVIEYKNANIQGSRSMNP